MTLLSVLTSRRTILRCALAIGMISPTGHLFAQRAALDVQIPFAFQDGSHSFPAGRYLVQNSGEHMVLIRNRAGDQIGISITTDQSRTRALDTGRLVFQKYGDRYFLHEIWLPDQTFGRQLVVSRAEKQLRGTPANRPAPGTQIALYVPQP